MKTIKNLFSIILWIGAIIIGNLIMLMRANGMGDNMKEAYGYVQKSFGKSIPFWLILALLLIIAITLNLHQSKGKITLVIALSVLTIITSIWFFMNFDNTLNNYDYMLTHMGVPEIGKAVVGYQLQGLLLTIFAIILSLYNVIRGIHNKKS